MLTVNKVEKREMWFYSMSNVLAGIVAQSFNVYALTFSVTEPALLSGTIYSHK